MQGGTVGLSGYTLIDLAAIGASIVVHACSPKGIAGQQPRPEMVTQSMERIGNSTRLPGVSLAPAAIVNRQFRAKHPRKTYPIEPRSLPRRKPRTASRCSPMPSAAAACWCQRWRYDAECHDSHQDSLAWNGRTALTVISRCFLVEVWAPRACILGKDRVRRKKRKPVCDWLKGVGGGTALSLGNSRYRIATAYSIDDGRPPAGFRGASSSVSWCVSHAPSVGSALRTQRQQ
jgi:hypothetical protein